MSMYFILIYLLTASGLSPGDSSTVHIYTQTIHRTIKKTIRRTTVGEVRLRKKERKKIDGGLFRSI